MYWLFQAAASPSFMKDRVYAIFILSLLYILSFNSRYKVTSCKNLLNSSLFPENGFGGFIFNLIGFGSFVTTGGCISASGWTMLTSSSVSVFLCLVVLSTIHLSGSESTGAVLKLSDVCVVL